MRYAEFPSDKIIDTVGQPFPNEHGLTTPLPNIEIVEGFEEKEDTVLALIKIAYPRLFLHPLYTALCDKIKEEWREREGHAAAQRASNKYKVFAFLSETAARECLKFLTREGRTFSEADIWLYNERVTAVRIPNPLENSAKRFRSATGEFVSSREAEDILNGVVASYDPTTIQALRQTIGAMHDTDADDVYLYPNGMNAIYAAFKAVAQKITRTIQVGFPYADTWTMQKEFGPQDEAKKSTYIRYDGAADLPALRAELEKSRLENNPVAAVFCEIPGNPLLRTIDLEKLKEILDEYNIPLIIDNTLGPPTNIDHEKLKRYADAIVTSLTKIISGCGDVMAGSVQLTTSSRYYNHLKQYFQATHKELLYQRDAHVMLNNAQGFAARMAIVNDNAKILFEYLSNHPAIDRIYYTTNDPSYELLRKEDGGYGGLLSFTLKDSWQMPDFYRRLRVFKGPSLGMENTLACPYTRLAHWDDRQFTEDNGVSFDLIRISVGMENPDEMIRRFEEALPASDPRSADPRPANLIRARPEWMPRAA